MAPLPVYSICLAPKDAYFKIVEKGEDAAKAPTIKVFHQAFVGGCYIGFGGLLSFVIAGQIPGADPGTQTFVFAALFPVNLLLILLTGASLYTGNTAAMPAACFEGRATWLDALRCLFVSWAGNFLSSILFAVLTEYTELCPTDFDADTGCGLLAATVAQKKVSKTFGQTFVKGIMCNWMVCMAVFLSSQAQDMTGKMVGIWFPISAFVCMGMEHSVANMFMLPLGLISGWHVEDQGGEFGVTVGELFAKNMLPVTLGNLFAGAICVAASYSYAFGRLGQPSIACGVADRCRCLIDPCRARMPTTKEHGETRAQTSPKRGHAQFVDPTPETSTAVWPQQMHPSPSRAMRPSKERRSKEGQEYLAVEPFNGRSSPASEEVTPS